ncbi:MAG TPA: DUF1178 family protein [Burkholderiaceae bacterium]|nr:DUF1178 family protein [Burkholderiaceae bacterium]
MKVFNLACEHDHPFEGWFSSADDYDRQLAQGLIECPMCASKAIRKMPAAPRLNLSAAQPPAVTESRGPGTGTPPGAAPTAEQMQALWMKMARHIIGNTEDVGDRFADEARRIHYHEAPARGIRGTASREQAADLEEEGIEVFSFPLPKALKEPLQ